MEFKMSFSINCLEITADKKVVSKNKLIHKNLSPKTKYFFNDYYEHLEEDELVHKDMETTFQDFFGKNITIQAIVGKNGSGKSSLMDILYMAINNLAFFITKKLNLPAASPIYYIPNLYVKLYFSIDSTECFLICENDKLTLKGKNNYHFDLKDEASFCDDNNTEEIAGLFFFTIVSNYSLQSFISSNYVLDVYDFTEGDDANSNAIELEWIDSIFYKNDGYTCPIVLNPFRGNGNINLNREMELSKDRLTSLLIWFSLTEEYNGNSPFAPYSYASIKIREKKEFVIGKFREYFNNLEKSEFVKALSEKDIINFINAELKNDESFLRKVLDIYSIDSNEICNNVFKKKTCAYLLLKLIFIPQRYASYGDFENTYNIKITNSGLLGEINDKEIIEEFLEKIKSDKSHITKKIRRVINFLRIPSDSIKSINKFYKALYLEKEKFSSPSEIDECLPPSLFSYDLFLKKKIKKQEVVIPYLGLSSGEIQMLQTLSIHTYHIENLISVPENDNRPKYKNINLVFDEVEICFHPEYQRQFVKRLLTVLNAIIKAEKGKVSFNIFIITHSPFILSDIPVDHVLFLADGKPSGENHSETFAGNIGEMFYDSFFLKSTIGAFAEEKIKRLIQKRQSRKTTMSDEEVDYLLKCIGDSVIKALIKETGKGKFDD